MALYRIEHLTFAYPATETGSMAALRDVTFEVSSGSFTVLAGASGCGKTTLLRLMKSALAPHGALEGGVFFDGRLLGEVPACEQAARIGFVMQIPEAQLVSTTVWHELAFGLENLGVAPAEMRLRVAEMAGFFGIEPWFRRSADELSGGQKQLLNLAAVMAMHPDVLLLDEPTAQLDPIAASDFLGAVAKINRELGCTVVMAEHRLDEVFPLADQVIVLDEGQLVAQGEPRRVTQALWEQGSALAPSLPAPAQVALAVEGDGGRELPLTVREGRGWLRDRLGEETRSVEGAAITSPESCCGALSAEAANKADTDGAPCSSERPKAVRGRSDASSCDSVMLAEGVRTASDKAALELTDLWFRYDREEGDVLRGASLTVPAGSLFALMGGNGAGKSTLLRLATGSLCPYRGQVNVLGAKVGGRRGRAVPGVALLPQDPRSLFAHDTVARELEEMRLVWETAKAPAAEEPTGKASKVTLMLGGKVLREASEATSAPSGGAAWEAYRQAIAVQCGIESLMESHPFDLSGGEQQRVALAKVLLARPRLLLLDEPTKSLDGARKESLAELLRSLTAQGITVLMVSHDVEFCARHADRVALLFDGEIVSEGASLTFFAANSFYTTAANRMSRGLLPDCITVDDVVRGCGEGRTS
ncbi:ABC transporter ATP-binding protein [Adlercreutzia equolifaciens]|uniref:ABC transporter ATP-binding protein n=1 Tax=Adlercreutzia equolifaciens TaxID=446660 RepID=UPI0023AF7673|nr:ABC transporter ATP-binding protein [Adlercreutzia equolifaciens]